MEVYARDFSKTRDVPRTRDSSGKYIPGSNAVYYRQKDPRINVYDCNQTYLIDGKLCKSPKHDSDSDSDDCYSPQKENVKKKECRKKERKCRGYESFRFTLSTPLSGFPKVCLPCDFAYKAIHLEDAYIQSDPIVFNDALCCGQDATLNQIWFTEGIINKCNDVKLTIGKCFIKSKTFTPIESFELFGPTVDGGFKQILIKVPCNNICGSCNIIYLLETCKLNPSNVQFWPFVVECMEGDYITASPRKNNKQNVYIPADFTPCDMLILPPLCPEQIADYVNDSGLDICVTWNPKREEYEVIYKCTPTKTVTKKLIVGEGEYYLARITPKKYSTAAELVPEIQRAMNPPLVTPTTNSITINDIVVTVDVREYEDPTILADHIEVNINNTLGWNDPLSSISVNYDDITGRFALSRVGPFKLSFNANSMRSLLGFSDYTYFGNNQYISNYQVYYVMKDAKCRYENPNNRYVASYDSINDLISIRAVSKSSYLQQLIPGFIHDIWYIYYPGNNYVLPFSFLCGSPFTNYLGFQEKGCFLEWISSVGISCLLTPPPLLYVYIPQLENDVIVSTCDKPFIKSAMAVLYLESNIKAYKTKCLPPNDLTDKKNVTRDKLSCLDLEFYTEQGTKFCFQNIRGVINWRVCV